MKNKLIFIALCLTLICCTLALASCTVVKEVPVTQDSDNTTNTPAPTPTHTHTFSSWVPGKNATCAEDGVIGHYTCTGCGKYFDNKKNEFSSVTISKDDFAHVFDSAFDTQCNGCGATYNPSAASINNNTLVIEYAGGRVESVSAREQAGCSHNMQVTIEGVRHTKFDKGSYVLSCSKCDYTTYSEKEALGHDEVENSGKAPTCTKNGWEAYVECSRCNYSTYKEISALGHDEIRHSGKTPTCTNNGWEAYVECSRCNYTTYKEIASSGHDEVRHSGKAATCTEGGYDAYVTCSKCSYSTYNATSKLGHNYVSGVCTRCGDGSSSGGDVGGGEPDEEETTDEDDGNDDWGGPVIPF